METKPHSEPEVKEEIGWIPSPSEIDTEILNMDCFCIYCGEQTIPKLDGFDPVCKACGEGYQIP